MKIRGLYTQKRSPFYWVRYYDRLEPEPKKKSKSICTKIEISPADRKRIEDATLQNVRPVLKGTPEVRVFAEAFRKGLHQVWVERTNNLKLDYELTLSEAYQKFKIARTIPGKKDELKQKTLLNYDKAIDHFIKACTDKAVHLYTQNDFHNLLRYFEAYSFKQSTNRKKVLKPGEKVMLKDLTLTSRSIYIRTLKALWNYFLTQGNVQTQIFENIRVEETDPEPIPLDDMWKIIRFLQGNTNYPNAYYIVKFLFLTGCRVSSAMVQLKENIDFGEKIIRIQNVKTGKRKGRDTYQFPLYGELERLIKDEMKVSPGESGRLFDHFNLNELNYTAPLEFWTRAMKRLARLGHIKKVYTLKQIRSTSATYFINNMKFDIYRVKKLLDHSDVKVTEKNYIQYNVDLVRQVLDEEMKMSKLIQNSITEV